MPSIFRQIGALTFQSNFSSMTFFYIFVHCAYVYVHICMYIPMRKTLSMFEQNENERKSFAFTDLLLSDYKTHIVESVNRFVRNLLHRIENASSKRVTRIVIKRCDETRIIRIRHCQFNRVRIHRRDSLRR